MTTTSTELTGKVALVTGGSRGLGREMVLALAGAGADVIIASRDFDSCQQLATTVRHQFGSRAHPVACNVSSWPQCDALVESAYTAFGQVDILINNAGMSPLYPSLDHVGETLFDKVIGVNLKAPFRLGAAIGTRMVRAGYGVIINISSAEATSPHPRSLPYAIAKAGLNALTEGLAQALAPTVRVNTIQCGPFRTDVASHWNVDTHAEIASRVPLGRPGEPHEVVGAVLYFAGQASTFCTGATLRLDGGIR